MEIYEFITILYEAIMLIFLIYNNSLSIPFIRFFFPALAYLLTNVLLNCFEIPILIKILIILFVTILILYFCRIMELKESIILCSTFIFCLSICDIITLEICDIIYMYIDLNYNILIFLIDSFSTFIMCCIIRKILGKNLSMLHVHNTIPLYIIISIDLLFVILTGSVITIIQPDLQYFLFIGTLFVCPLILFNLFLLMYFIHCKEIEYNNNIDLSRLENDYKYYKGKMEDNLRLQEILHDFKNHLLILESNITSEEKSKYLNHLEEEILFYDNNYNTGNNYLNIILNEKANTAKEANILFDFQMTINNLDFFQPEDICSFFGNVLDNAIEACQKTETSCNRFIKIRISRKNNFIIIAVSNSSPYVTINTKTDKDDFLLHGHGLKNIRKCISKYNGTVQLKNENNIFYLFALIPNSNNLLT